MTKLKLKLVLYNLLFIVFILAEFFASIEAKQQK